MKRRVRWPLIGACIAGTLLVSAAALASSVQDLPVRIGMTTMPKDPGAGCGSDLSSRDEPGTESSGDEERVLCVEIEEYEVKVIDIPADLATDDTPNEEADGWAEGDG